MTPATQQLIDAAFEMMAATKKEYPKEGTPEFFALTDVAHRLECAGIAYKRELVAAKESVPPEARAVEAAKEIACKYHYQFDNSFIRKELAAIIQRTCFPAGEGEEWAKKAAGDCVDTAVSAYQDIRFTRSDAVSDCTAIILKHAPARPTAAREDTAPKNQTYNPRKIATDFLNLPLHLKLRVAKELELSEDGDAHLADADMFRAFFRRANDQGKVAQLAAAIDAARGANNRKETQLP